MLTASSGSEKRRDFASIYSIIYIVGWSERKSVLNRTKNLGKSCFSVYFSFDFQNPVTLYHITWYKVSFGSKTDADILKVTASFINHA